MVLVDGCHRPWIRFEPATRLFWCSRNDLGVSRAAPDTCRSTFPIKGVSGFSNRKPLDTRHHSLRTVPPRGLEAAPAKIFPIGKPRLPRSAERLTIRQGPLATMVHTLIALAPSWWPGPRGQGRVHSVERHQ